MLTPMLIKKWMKSGIMVEWRVILFQFFRAVIWFMGFVVLFYSYGVFDFSFVISSLQLMPIVVGLWGGYTF